MSGSVGNSTQAHKALTPGRAAPSFSAQVALSRGTRGHDTDPFRTEFVKGVVTVGIAKPITSLLGE
jgi:hypothetical protein